MNEVISARITHEDVVETYHRTEIVPTAIHNKKSPVGRAIVGGVLLGPAGVVMGAASGLGGKKKIITEERTVLGERIVKGPPILTIGSVGSAGILNVSFAGPNAAEHWLNQIRNAKAALSLPPPY